MEEVIERYRQARGQLLWALYNHQGGSSEVGQAIRKALGMKPDEHMTDEQVTAACAWKQSTFDLSGR